MGPRVDLIVRTGGILAVLVIIHFVIDWVFQSHAEAMKKHDHPWVRARHCLIYTAPFIPLMLWTRVPSMWVAIGGTILFLSHFIEDTYIPVFWWAKYIRRPPEMMGRPLAVIDDEIRDVEGTLRLWRMAKEKNYKAASTLDEGAITEKIAALHEEKRWTPQQKAKLGFLPFVTTPLGKILMIAIDQIIHIVFLLPIAWIVLTYGS